MPFQGGCCAFVDGFSELLERRQVQIKPQIDYLTENEVVFEDGTVLDNVDIILFATGYLPDYDIIDIHGITGEWNREFSYIYFLKMGMKLFLQSKFYTTKRYPE